MKTINIFSKKINPKVTPNVMLCLIFQMKLLPVSVGLVICLLTGLTRQRASPIFLRRVSQSRVKNTRTSVCWLHRITTMCIFWVCACMRNLSRICIPAVPRWELCSGFNRCLHSGGWQALPVCLQPHYQRQACKCVLSFCVPHLPHACCSASVQSTEITQGFIPISEN